MPRMEINENIKRKIEYFPCVKCGGEKIVFNDCGYSSFNIAWGKCKDCNNEIIINPCNWNISKEEIITEWNKANNPKILREKYQEQINQLQKLIDNLPIDKKVIIN